MTLVDAIKKAREACSALKLSGLRGRIARDSTDRIEAGEREQIAFTSLSAALDAIEREAAAWLRSESELSDAYLDIRREVDAWGTQHGGGDRFAVTLGRVRELKARIALLEAALTEITYAAERYMNYHGEKFYALRKPVGLWPAIAAARAALRKDD